MRCDSSYLGSVLRPDLFEKSLAWLVHTIDASGVYFDAVAFTGCSGCLVGAALAARLGKGCLLVRKEMDHSHASVSIEGALDAMRYIIVDDLQCSGATVDRIKKKLAPRYCAGVFLYHEQEATVYARSPSGVGGKKKRAPSKKKAVSGEPLADGGPPNCHGLSDIAYKNARAVALFNNGFGEVGA